MKRKFEKIFMYVGMIFIGLLIIGLIIALIPIKYELEFYFNDESLIDGDIYFNGFFMGSTNNGLIKIPEKKLGAGELTFVGIDEKGESYSIYYNLDEEDYDSYYLTFTFDENDIISSQLNLSNIDEDKLKNDVFDLINKKRKENWIEEVKRNNLLDQVAQDYSKEMITTDLFAHEPYEGYGPGERLKQKGVFYLSYSEVLSQNYFYDEKEFANEIVEGWIDSPSHRSTILDSGNPIYWESLGVGVSCKDNEEGIICYVVGLFAKLEEHYSDNLNEDYFIPYELYPEGFDYDYPVNTKIIFNSDHDMDLILLETMKDYDRLLSRNKYTEIFEEKRIKNFEKEIEIQKGNVLVPHASVRDSNYNLTIIYNI
jgi:uncharacterized protein YkwD